jgi:tetratricopeptide (TPR) repeat protein
MVAMALIVGLGVATWFWHQERNARKRAVVAEHQALAAEQQQAKLRMEAEDRERITQAAFLISQGKTEEADQMVDKLSELKPSLEAESVLRSLGDWHALKGQWAQAAKRFNLLLEADQKDNSWTITEDLLKAGPIQIELGNMQGYERFRRAAIARYTGATDPVFAERTLKISLLLPADEPLIKSLEPLSEVSASSMNAVEGQDPIMTSWRCISLALMAYRQNYTPTAKVWCQRCLSYSESNSCRIATAHIIQAMACDQLGEVETARLELVQGRDLTTAQFAKGLGAGTGTDGYWFDWLFARILLREAEALIETAPSVGK